MQTCRPGTRRFSPKFLTTCSCPLHPPVVSGTAGTPNNPALPITPSSAPLTVPHGPGHLHPQSVPQQSHRVCATRGCKLGFRIGEYRLQCTGNHLVDPGGASGLASGPFLFPAGIGILFQSTIHKNQHFPFIPLRLVSKAKVAPPVYISG